MTTQNTLSLFDFKEHKIRIVLIDGSPWFLATDVTAILGLSNTAVALLNLDAEERQHLKASNVSRTDISFPNRGASGVSESALYKMILRSNKKEAVEFQNWVTKDVLPAIRKDGMYIMGEEKVATGEMSMDEMILKGMTYLFKQGAHYSVYSKYRDVLFAHTIDGAYGTHDIAVLAKGKELLVRLHADKRLTMKAGYYFFDFS